MSHNLPPQVTTRTLRYNWNAFVNTLSCTGEASVLCCTMLTLMLARETRTIVTLAQLVSVGTKLDTRTNSLTMLIHVAT